VPRDGDNTSIDAAYGGWRSRANYRFAVATGRDAIKLAPALAVSALDTDRRVIADVKIEILSGPYAGQTRDANSTGFAAFDFFPVGVPFTLRASKTGYQTVTQN
jgi:hypothetical protein